jgi:hypothetical protein
MFGTHSDLMSPRCDTNLGLKALRGSGGITRYVWKGGLLFSYLDAPSVISFIPDLRKLGPRLKVVAVVDPNIEQISTVLQQKLTTVSGPSYKDTRIFKTLDDFVNDWPLSRKHLHAFTIASPAFTRGTMQPGRDIEMQIMKHFPTVSISVEMPLSCAPMTEMDDVFKVAKRITNAGTICSVGFVALDLREYLC